jgi:hypothetical protein
MTINIFTAMKNLKSHISKAVNCGYELNFELMVKNFNEQSNKQAACCFSITEANFNDGGS